MATTFSTATRRSLKLRLAIDGAAGSGKTYTALRIAHGLGQHVFVIDTQYGSAGLYAGEVEDGVTWNFQHAVLNQYTVEWYEDAIHTAERLGADVIVIDSLSSAWDDTGGILEQVDREAEKRSSDGRPKGSFAAWGKGGQLYKRLIKAMLASPCHIIATLRTKTDYVMEADENGKMKVRKLGLRPIQREGVDYEFDLGFSMAMDHTAVVTKTHCKLFPSGMEIPSPGKETAQRILEWLDAGADTAGPVSSSAPETPAEATGTEVPEASHVVGAEPSPSAATAEVAERRRAIQESLKDGTLTREEFREWRQLHGITTSRPLSDMEVLQLAGDIQTKRATGEWNPAPF